MKYYWMPDLRRYARTQGDAKDLVGANFELEDWAIDSHGLIAQLNAKLTEIYTQHDEEKAALLAELEALRQSQPSPAENQDVPIQTEAAPKVRKGKDVEPALSLEEQIFDLDGVPLLNVLQAAIERLHSSAGPAGWKAFAKHATSWNGSSGVATDRGLGMLVLAGLSQLSGPI